MVLVSTVINKIFIPPALQIVFYLYAVAVSQILLI